MTFWRRLPAVIAVTFVVTAMTVDFVYTVKAHHDEKVLQRENSRTEFRSELVQECEWSFPNSPANQLRCFDEGQ